MNVRVPRLVLAAALLVGGAGCTTPETVSPAGDGSVAVAPGTAGQPAAAEVVQPSDDEASGAPSVAAPAAAATPTQAEAGAGIDAVAALLPAGPDAVLALDFGAVLQSLRASVASVPGAEIQDALVDSIGRYLLEQAEVPLAVRERLIPSRLGAMVVALWADSESVVVGLAAAAVTDPPAEGSGAQVFGAAPVQIVRRGEYVLIGLGAEFKNAASGNAAAQPGPTGSPWTVAWSNMPPGAFLRIALPDARALPESERADLAALGLGEIRSGAFAIALDGSTVLTVDADSDEALRRALAGGYRYAADAITELRAVMPPPAQGWAAYADLLLRGLYSHLHIERTGTQTTVRIAASRCDPGLLLPALILGLASAATTELPEGTQAVWEPIAQPLAERCVGIPGPAGRIPSSLAALGPSAMPDQAVLGLFDYGALLRDGLPTFFGLAPFALRPEDVVAALPPSAAGLASWDTTEGSGAAFVDLSGSFVGAAWAAVLPAAVAGAVPPMPDPTLVRELRAGTGLVTGHAAVVSRLSEPSPTDWTRAMSALPPGTTLAYALSGGVLREAAAQAPSTELSAIYASTRLMAFGVSGIRPTAVVLVVDGDAAALASQINDRIAAAGRELSANLSPSLAGLGPLWDAYAATFRSRAIDGSTIVMEMVLPETLSNADLFLAGAALAVAGGAWDQYRALSSAAGPPEAVEPPDAVAPPGTNPKPPGAVPTPNKP